MREKPTLVIEIQNEIQKYQSAPLSFFGEINKKYSKDDLPDIYSWIIENIKDIVFLNQTFKEIDKLRNIKNLDNLIDFIMLKPDNSLICSISSQNDYINLKVFAIKVIANYQNKKAVPALLYCLNSKTENYKIRLCVAEALGKIGDKDAVDSLINVVKDEDEKSVYVRESAAKALGMLGDIKAIEAFIGILESKKTFIDKFTFLKEQIIEAIGKMNTGNDKKVLEVLVNSLEDESSQIRLNAIESLSNSDFEEADNLISKMLFDIDTEVKKGALISLYNMGGKPRIAKVLEENALDDILLNLAQELLDMEEDEDE